METKKLTIHQIQEMKLRKEKITSITAYDYPFARLADEAGFEVVFLGDSLGMVCLGYNSTVPVTMDEILHHLKVVAGTCKRALIIGDMPYGSYYQSNEQAIENAIVLMQAGADSVKVEGGGVIIDRLKAVVGVGIPCMGHLGITPQFIAQLGSYRARGKKLAEAKRIFDDAVAIERAGAWAIQLEGVAAPLSKLITETLTIPVFGAGCGPDCDAQGLNLYDVLGLFDKFLPKMSKKYVNLWEISLKALKEFAQEIRDVKFPTDENAFKMPQSEFEELLELIKCESPHNSNDG